MSLHRLSLLALVLLALLLPFELEAPWLTLGPVVLTNVELLLGAVLGLSVLTAWKREELSRAQHSQRGSTWPDLPLAWLALLGLVAASLLLSSILAPVYRANALKAALRSLSGLALAASAFYLVRSRRDLHWLVGGLVGGGLLAAILGVAEIIRNAEYPLLRLFRPGPTVAGPFLRLAGPFDYANQGAMYFEATLPLLLVVGWLAWRQRRLPAALLSGAAILFYTQAAILTLSRTVFTTLILVNFAVALLLWHRHREVRSSSALFAGAAAVVVLLISVNVLLNPVFRLRFSSESDNDWYRARIEGPAELELTVGEKRLVDVTVANDGVFTWRSTGSRPIRLAARWVQPETERQLPAHPRWPLAQPLAPGESQTVTVELSAPEQPGEYQLVWDLVQEHVTWFSSKSGLETVTAVTVAGSAPVAAVEQGAADGEETFEEAWQFAAPIPGRRTLWQAAWRLWQERPVLGIGLDNYRLRYGEVLGYESWNETIHTNNWYIETVVSLGLLGALPFLSWLGLLVWDVVRRLGSGGAGLWSAAVAAGLLAYLVHGLLDYFLLFNATGLLFWILVGLWIRLAHGGEMVGEGQHTPSTP